MGMAGLILEPHLSKFGKSFLFYSCTSDVIVISRNSQRVKSYKNTQKPSSPGIQRFLTISRDDVSSYSYSSSKNRHCAGSTRFLAADALGWLHTRMALSHIDELSKRGIGWMNPRWRVGDESLFVCSRFSPFGIEFEWEVPLLLKRDS